MVASGRVFHTWSEVWSQVLGFRGEVSSQVMLTMSEKLPQVVNLATPVQLKSSDLTWVPGSENSRGMYNSQKLLSLEKACTMQSSLLPRNSTFTIASYRQVNNNATMKRKWLVWALLQELAGVFSLQHFSYLVTFFLLNFKGIKSPL